MIFELSNIELVSEPKWPGDNETLSQTVMTLLASKGAPIDGFFVKRLRPGYKWKRIDTHDGIVFEVTEI